MTFVSYCSLLFLVYNLLSLKINRALLNATMSQEMEWKLDLVLVLSPKRRKVLLLEIKPMAKLSDTKIPITDFLEAYRCQPCLYNTLLDTYKNRVSREDAYKAIIKSLKIPQLTVMDIKLKIKSVRTVYSKELRIWMREKEMGRSYEPKLFWFKLADSFLRSVSLSNGKRIKTKTICPNLETSQMTVKKEASLNSHRKLVFSTSGDISMSEDTMEAEDQELEEEQLDPDPVGSIEGTESMRTHENESQGIISAVISASEIGRPTAIEGSTATGKTEINIDDSSFCVLGQQQQQQQHQQQQQLHQQQQQAHIPLRKLKLNTQGTGQNQLTHDSSTSSSTLPAGADDDLVFFGQSIASQLRTITDSYSRSVAKLRIQQVLFEAETGQFQNSASQEPISTHLHTF